MQQAIYTNTHIAKPSVVSGHGTGVYLETRQGQFQGQRFSKLRITMSVAGNVLGGAILLSGMLMLPQLVVSLLAG